MHRHIAFKFIAVVLCAAALLGAVASGLGIFALAASGIYADTTVEQLRQQQRQAVVSSLARAVTTQYLSTTKENVPESYFIYRQMEYPFTEVREGKWHYTIFDEIGSPVATQGGIFFPTPQSQSYTEVCAPYYYTVAEERVLDASTGEILSTYVSEDSVSGTWTESYRYEDQDGRIHRLTLAVRQSAETYTVELHFLEDAFLEDPQLQWAWQLLELGQTYRLELIIALGGFLLLFGVLLAYLCCIAGRKPGSQDATPAGLNRFPLDLYALVTALATAFTIYVSYELISWNSHLFDPIWLLALLIGAMGYICCLLAVGLVFAIAAQSKAGRGYWYTHALLGRLIQLLGKIFAWCGKGLGKVFAWLKAKLPPALRKLFSFLKAAVIALYRGIKKMLQALFRGLARLASGLLHGIRRFVDLLPLTWQWLLTGFLLLLVMALTLNAPTVVVILGIGICLAVILYGAHCFGLLLETTQRMSRGDLDTQVKSDLLLGSFRDYASALNALAGVAVEAARKQMRSERMKAELVTNVSHDIKTPLTSIINYVDLLQKAETPEQTAQCLEVLDRQSQRLKKLIDDLMEMSKASTGNMAVELTRLDAGEAINQALGEFADKLTAAQLTPVFNAPEEPIALRADGRLTWRVLSNLLSNAVKYALPNTRLYIDLVRLEGKVLISLKNISRDQLGISAEELMERFVRADASRNTEGSGLGLNIAKNLMELQHGQLQLLVDGDLFKATLIFPESE